LLSTVATSALEADWGDELKVEIPETGVSLGEVGRYLRRHLGSETRISGEVVRTVSGLTVAARVNGQPAGQVEGSENELDALISHAGEQVMSTALPFHYASALANVGRGDDAIAVVKRLAQSATTAMDRSAAYTNWSYRLLDRGDYVEAEAKARIAMRLTPEGVGNAQFRLWDVDYSRGRFESAHRNALASAVNFHAVSSKFYSPNALLRLLASIRCEQLLLAGDLQAAAQASRDAVAAASTQAAISMIPWGRPYLLVLEHDLASAQSEADVIEDPPAPKSPSSVQPRFRRRAEAMGALSIAREDWDGAVAAYQRGIDEAPSRALPLKPWLAYALARKGDMPSADMALQDTPDDCYPCLRARGKIAAIKRDWQEAERWFAEAARQGPSLPWANTDWAEMLMAKGDAQGAITQAREAIKRGPKFADAYQALGEALALSGDYADAVKQFEQAATYAPKWGRTQILWGISLGKLGRSTEAQGKFTVAKTFELAPSEQLLLRIATSERGVTNDK
jgi:tetratricopeptide (TPR) repeat protein